jgi:hypothetical protein
LFIWRTRSLRLRLALLCWIVGLRGLALIIEHRCSRAAHMDVLREVYDAYARERARLLSVLLGRKLAAAAERAVAAISAGGAQAAAAAAAALAGRARERAARAPTPPSPAPPPAAGLAASHAAYAAALRLRAPPRAVDARPRWRGR